MALLQYSLYNEKKKLRHTLREEINLSPQDQEKSSLVMSLKSNESLGLTNEQAQEVLSKYGANKLKEGKKRTTLQKFLEQFKDVMIVILLIAAAISFGIAIMEHNTNAFFEPFLILLIVVINAVMGVAQESKAEKSLEALQNLSAPLARVIRDGQECIIEAASLVPGDIIKLEAGDFVPADARLLRSSSLKSEESALTGESVPSDKNANTMVEENAPIGDRVNTVFSGCSITYGAATAIVTQTGMNTEMGKIADLLEGAGDVQTPLQLKLAQLGKYLGIMALAVCGIIFVMGIIDEMPIIEIFMTSVSLAVAAIPEGLPVIVTIVLSIGVDRMAKRHAIVKRLPAVETLGSTSIICSDKTGTLTQNKMTLVKAYSDQEKESQDICEHNSKAIQDLLTYATLCSDGTVKYGGGKEEHIGDPTETCIVAAAHKNGIEKEELFQQFPRIAGIPFDSDRKLMSSVHHINGKNIVITKGAFDVLNARCIAGDLGQAADIVTAYSKDALRVLAVAYKEIDQVPEEPTTEFLENDLTFIGLVGMIDPPREEAKEAVAICRKAGIKPVMITGDHVLTASAIASAIGIFQEGDDAITGVELQAMSDEEFDQRLEHISVYARVSPEDKIRVVRAWQKKDKVVSMTGDGVNDAPALKAADIGCAMGITGTDVAKGAADMTLTDDNFATIVAAVKEGRGIYNNIKKVVGYLLGTNVGEILIVFLAMLLWKQAPLISTQLLWINLVTDSFPAIALGMEPVEEDVMLKKPKPKKEGLFAHGYGFQVILQGIMFGGLALTAFRVGWIYGGSIEAGRTVAFIEMALSQVFHSFNMRSVHSLFKIGVFTNKSLNIAATISIVLVFGVVVIPAVSGAFGLVHVSAGLYAAAIGIACIPVVILEIAKALNLVIE